MFRVISFREAINEALEESMKKDNNVFTIGEDIGIYGGAFHVTEGLLDKFGKKRVIDTPMSESALTGIVTGASIYGLRPILEIMFSDFLTLALDQILNHMTKFRYISNGQIKVPLVIRTPSGGGRGYGSTHSQALETLLLTVPGLKIIAPSTPFDAKGLLISAIFDDNPVVFIEHKTLYGLKGKVNRGFYSLPLDKAKIVVPGQDITIISYGNGLQLCYDAIAELRTEGFEIEPELIDLVSIKPLDLYTIIKSIKKTHRAVVLEDGCLTGGVGAEIIAQIQEKTFDYLDAPLIRIAAKDLPIPCSPVLENEVLPKITDLKNSIKTII